MIISPSPCKVELNSLIVIDVCEVRYAITHAIAIFYAYSKTGVFTQTHVQQAVIKKHFRCVYRHEHNINIHDDSLDLFSHMY